MTLTYLGEAVLLAVAAWGIYDNFRDSQKSTYQPSNKLAEDDSSPLGESITDASTDAGYIGVYSDIEMLSDDD